MKALAIINPTAGGGRARRLWPSLRARFMEAGWTVEDATADRSGHEAELAAAAARAGVQVILVVGGDGTCHWTANGLLRDASDTNGTPLLAVVPVGTGNDFAGALGLPKDPRAAVESILAGRPRRIDVGVVGGRYFLSAGMVGFGAEVARQVNEWPKRLPGPAMYIAGIIKTLVTYAPVEMEVSLDGRVERRRLFMIAAGNTFRAAGGMRLCPGARADDGLFEVVLIGDLTRLEVLRILPQAFPGRHVLHPKVRVEAAANVAVTSPFPLAVQADGEVIGRVPAVFTVRPNALGVLAPADQTPSLTRSH